MGKWCILRFSIPLFPVKICKDMLLKLVNDAKFNNWYVSVQLEMGGCCGATPIGNWLLRFS